MTAKKAAAQKVTPQTPCGSCQHSAKEHRRRKGDPPLRFTCTAIITHDTADETPSGEEVVVIEVDGFCPCEDYVPPWAAPRRRTRRRT